MVGRVAVAASPINRLVQGGRNSVVECQLPKRRLAFFVALPAFRAVNPFYSPQDV